MPKEGTESRTRWSPTKKLHHQAVLLVNLLNFYLPFVSVFSLFSIALLSLTLPFFAFAPLAAWIETERRRGKKRLPRHLWERRRGGGDHGEWTLFFFFLPLSITFSLSLNGRCLCGSSRYSLSPAAG